MSQLHCRPETVEVRRSRRPTLLLPFLAALVVAVALGLKVSSLRMELDAVRANCSAEAKP